MKLSIITINYLNFDGLQKTIESIVSQSYKNFEWIVIDGGSTDGSRKLIEQHQDAMAYWCSEPDRGIYHAMNKGVVQAKGDYCLFLNSGDILHNEHVIKDVIPFLDGTDIVAGDEWRVDEDYSFIKLNKNPQEISTYFFLVSSLFHQGVFMRRSILEAYPFDETMKITADWAEMFYVFLSRGMSYKHIDVVVSDFVAGGASDQDWDLLCAERKSIYDKYLTHRQQDEVSLQYHCIRDEEFSKRYMAEVAYTAFANNYYSQQEYLDIFTPYRKTLISSSSFYHRFFNLMCLSGYMTLAWKLYICLSKICKLSK